MTAPTASFRLLPQGLLALAWVAFSGVPAVASPQSLRVAAVESSTAADVVLVEAGFEAGLRSGMVARIMREDADVAEIVMVDVRPSVSAGLILSLTAGASIRPGDAVVAKTFKSQTS